MKAKSCQSQPPPKLGHVQDWGFFDTEYPGFFLVFFAMPEFATTRVCYVFVMIVKSAIVCFFCLLLFKACPSSMAALLLWWHLPPKSFLLPPPCPCLHQPVLRSQPVAENTLRGEHFACIGPVVLSQEAKKKGVCVRVNTKVLIFIGESTIMSGGGGRLRRSLRRKMRVAR